MPRKKQQCGFRIPWISGPSSESYSPPPKQKSNTNRPLFRPPGIASTPPQPPPRETPKTETQQVSTSLPSHSPAPSVIIDSPVSSLSEPPSTPSTPTPSDPNVKELELDSTPTENSNAPLEKQSKPHQSKSNTNTIKRGPSIPRPKKTELHETADKKQTRETVERNMMFATSTTTSGKDIKVVTPASTSATISLSKEENPTIKNKDDDISALNPTLNVDDKTVSVVTLAGDNRGVTMHVAGSQGMKSTCTQKDEAGKTYVNSNIQSINNSIMSHGSISGRDPGVRVVLPQQPQPVVKQQPCLDKPKAEVSINRTERVPYGPVVRRRCLRGLLLEPSDSEPDNPDKPRRHGCKFRCGENTKG